MKKKLNYRDSIIGIVGLGYVGLPLAINFSTHFKVIGYDISNKRTSELDSGFDINQETASELLENKNLSFTSNETDLSSADTFIVTVPTPVSQENVPDLDPLKNATKMIGGNIKKGSLVVYESTVSPGITEDICIPILEKISNLNFGKDFMVGYSPERVVPGKGSKPISSITKIIAANDQATVERMQLLYSTFMGDNLHIAQSIKIGEASKLLENTQRDVNIALINEFDQYLSGMNVSIHDVLKAASTKWNFLQFTPGLVGGHCICVDPYYFIQSAKERGFNPMVSESSRLRNELYVKFKTDDLVKQLTKLQAKEVLVCGVTFKPNCADIRNSKAYEIALNLEEKFSISVYDPYWKSFPITNNCPNFKNKISDEYDAVVILVEHDEFLDNTFLNSISVNHILRIV